MASNLKRSMSSYLPSAGRCTPALCKPMSSRGFASISYMPIKAPQILTHNVSHLSRDVLSPKIKSVLLMQPPHKQASSCFSLLLQASSHQGLVNLHSSIAFVWKWRCIFLRPAMALRSLQTFRLSPVVSLLSSIWEWLSGGRLRLQRER